MSAWDFRESDTTAQQDQIGPRFTGKEVYAAFLYSEREKEGVMRVRMIVFFGVVLALLLLALLPGAAVSPTGFTVVAWNNLGMHCMDADFGVFAILPPYNTIQAHVIDSSGHLVKSPSAVSVTYEAIADPSGSINTTSLGKTNFWDHVIALFGAPLAVDAGLAGKDMPGPSNTPGAMAFDPARNWFIAEGIPITPYDDSGQKNPYPLMKVTARDRAGNVLASTRIVLPVSDEMDCRTCHASGSPIDARPAAGWVWDPDPERDYRLNVLRLHDEAAASSPAYAPALAAAGYDPAGLYPTVTVRGRAVLCAACHSSEALPGSGRPGIPPLTQAVHALHEGVNDPTTGQSLGSSANRSACYRCHPGSETKCLRGAMGAATAADGSMLMQCQSCHGGMAAVGAATRTGWLDEPSCQQCHTGTATRNSGQIRFTSVFDTAGNPRVAADARFATNADTPAAGLSLYRFSAGHGGLQCSACHGATHAEYPSSHENDNLQSLDLQGHAGTLGECAACHGRNVPESTSGGPHGMHPVGSSWVDHHHDAAEHGGLSSCRACHGGDDRGTVLSRMFTTRNLETKVGTRTFAAGTAIGCYSCHNGPDGEGNPPGGGPPTPTPTPRATATPRPSPTPTVTPTRTPEPTRTPNPSPTPTVRPTKTPRPTATPKPTRRARWDGEENGTAAAAGVRDRVPSPR